MLITEKQLSHRLEITLPTLNRWRKKANLPFQKIKLPEHKLKNSVLYDVEEVKQWLLNYRPLLVKKLMEGACACKACERGGIDLPANYFYNRIEADIANPPSAV